MLPTAALTTQPLGLDFERGHLSGCVRQCFVQRIFSFNFEWAHPSVKFQKMQQYTEQLMADGGWEEEV